MGREVIILTTFIGLSAAIKARSMIKIDALAQLVPRLKIPLSIFSNVVTLVFSLMMVFYGWKITMLQASTRQKTIIMEIPLELLYAVLPIMGVLMFLRTLQVIHEDIKQLRSRPGSS
jgi:TRAP-type C4-dicarboxylate transport system permease small subunit